MPETWTYSRTRLSPPNDPEKMKTKVSFVFRGNKKLKQETLNVRRFSKKKQSVEQKSQVQHFFTCLSQLLFGLRKKVVD